MKKLFCLIIIITALFPAAVHAKKEKMQVAVLDFKTRSVTATLGQIISDLVRAEMVKTGYFIVVERGQMDEILKEQGFQKTGCTDNECAVELGKLLSAKKILLGEASKLGSSILITVRIVDVEKGVAEFAESEKAENEDKIDEACKLLTKKLTKNIISGGKADLSLEDDGKGAFDKKYQIYESARKSQITGCCWGAVLPGGQHFYSGKYGTGALYLIGTIIPYVIFLNNQNKADEAAADEADEFDSTNSESAKYEDRAQIAAVIIVIVRIADIIHGYTNIESYNEELRKSLDVISGQNEVKFNFDVAYSPKMNENQYLVGMTMGF